MMPPVPRFASTLSIILIAATLGLVATWRAPGLDRYARDLLMRIRGTLPVPSDIAIVAIDEPSIRRFGRFPWRRSVMARAIERIDAGQPKVIALDVLYTDPSNDEDDLALASAIGNARNVVVAAQLVNVQSFDGPVTWLDPLPSIRRAAASVAHVNVETEAEGVAREVLIRTSDDSGHVLRAMPVEAVRIADGTPEQSVKDRSHSVLLGSRSIIVQVALPGVVVRATHAKDNSPEFLRAARMAIDYIGPAGSFGPNTYSVSEVIEGRVPPSSFKDRYVLIGATAASLGDRLSSPFVHHASDELDQHGSLMPGVEVLANAVNTILRSRFYSETSDWAAFLWAAMIAATTLALLDMAQGRYESLKQAAVLIGIATSVLVWAYTSFVHLLIFAPVVPGLIAFASSGMLGLLRRSLVTSAQLDAGIKEIAKAGDLLVPSSSAQATSESVAALLGVPAVAIFNSEANGRHSLAGGHGFPAVSSFESESLSADDKNPSDFFTLPSMHANELALLACPLHDRDQLLILHPAGHAPPREALRLATAIAASHTWMSSHSRSAVATPTWWPDSLEAKAALLGSLNARLIEASHFVESAMRAVEDGLIIAGPDGAIRFANRKAAAILQSTEPDLIGANLLDQLSAAEGHSESAESSLRKRRSILARILLERASIEREITVTGVRDRRYVLRMAGVIADEDPARPILGIVASLSDITRQQELQQTKNDVIALVSHEMRTPLTAIQGMSELLANYDVDPERGREMNLAINDEVKRLSRMIGQYLDITRLESGATVLRYSAFRAETLVERTLLLLDPIAAKRDISLARRFDTDLPVVFADPDLIGRAVENLVSNAIKYSPSGTEVMTAIRGVRDEIVVEVSDRGCGIPSKDLQKVFEKFYRVPRVQDADVPGTGLGLALVREIAQLHGGVVRVRSEVDHGSTFELCIPWSVKKC